MEVFPAYGVPVQWLVFAIMLMSFGAADTALILGNYFAAIGFIVAASSLCALNLSFDPISRKWLFRLLRVPLGADTP